MSNAIKHTPDGGTVSVQMRHAQELVELIITDTGIGISAASLPHVFELFTHAERFPDRTQGGLVSGLAAVKNLVELHGGSVEARSGGNFTGSTFIIRLPSIASVESESFSQDAVPVVASAGPMRILVVDDNADVARMLAKFLVAAGQDAVAVNDANEALAMAARKSFDAYLLDIGLPDIDGNALARCLRKIPHAKDALIVAITGYGKKFDRQKSLESGFDHYFVKPVNPIELVALLVKWKNHESLEDALTDANKANV
jgi:CheY-like chemotaxis protein